jgi:hypothetical protein
MDVIRVCNDGLQRLAAKGVLAVRLTAVSSSIGTWRADIR